MRALGELDVGKRESEREREREDVLSLSTSPSVPLTADSKKKKKKKKKSFPRTKARKLAAGHALKDHAHSKKGYKRVGVAEGGGKFVIRPKSWSGPAATDAEAEVPAASLSDVELSPGDSVDIPPGLVHSAWVVGDEGIVFVMGDEEEEE